MTRMKNFAQRIIRKYPEILLGIFSLLFIAGIVYAYTWGVSNVVSVVQSVGSPPSTNATPPGFNLAVARALDLRGLVKPSP